MSNKQQAMANKTKARRSKRLKDKKTKNSANANRSVRHAIDRNQTYTIAELADSLVKSGVRIKKGNPPDNEEVKLMMGAMVNQLIVVHAALEITEILNKEQGAVFSPEQQVIVDQFDETVVKLSEDVNVILEFMENGHDMNAYLDVFFHMTDLVQQLSNTKMYGIYDKVVEPQGDLIREYLGEHMPQEQDSVLFSLDYHNKRIARISSKYATKVSEGLTATDIMQMPAAQLFGEEGLESDEEALAAKAVAEEAPVAVVE